MTMCRSVFVIVAQQHVVHSPESFIYVPCTLALSSSFVLSFLHTRIELLAVILSHLSVI